MSDRPTTWRARRAAARTLAWRSLLAAVACAAIIGPGGAQAASAPDGVNLPNFGDKDTPFTGSGYWTYSCSAARDAGYVGDLDQMFTFHVDDFWIDFPGGVRTQRQFGRMTTGQNPPSIVPLNATAPDMNTHFAYWDTCDSSSADPMLAIRRKPSLSVLFRGDVGGDGVERGALGLYWEANMPDPGTGLSISKFWVENEQHSYVSSNTYTGALPPPTLADRRALNPNWGTSMLVSRKNLVGDARGDAAVSCGGNGKWSDPDIVGGTNPWWKDVTSQATGDADAEENNYTTRWFGGVNTPFYTKPRADGIVSDYSSFMGGSGGTAADPDSRCNISTLGGPWVRKLYRMDGGQFLTGISFRLNCGETKYLSRTPCKSVGNTTAWDESPNAEVGANSAGGVSNYMRGARFYVHDSTAPSVGVGAITPDGTINKEAFTWAASDNGGLRHIYLDLAKPDGSRVRMATYTNDVGGNICDYRYLVPCPGGTGGNPYTATAPWGSAAVQAQFAGPFYYNVDDLPVGRYTLIVGAIDAAAHTTEGATTFDVNAIVTSECNGEKRLSSQVATTCGNNVVICSTNCTPVDSKLAIGPDPVVAPPAGTGQALFTYDLAFNNTPTSTAPNTANCKVIESVISGSSADGSLSDREKNQIISVTLNLAGFAPEGSTLGQQDLRTTFDLPGRRNGRYRNALGCPS